MTEAPGRVAPVEGAGYLARFLGPEEIRCWDTMAQAAAHSCFMQSAAWAAFKEREGYRAYFAGVWTADRLVGGMVLYGYPESCGAALLAAPGGPVLPGEHYVVGLRLLSRLCRNLATALGIAAIRIEPAVPLDGDGLPYLQDALVSLGYSRAPGDILPSQSWIVDLRQSDEVLLAHMKHKGRYNIGIARRHGIAVRFSQDERDIPMFYRMFSLTARRKRFFGEPYAFFINLCQTLFASGNAELGFAESNGQAVAAILVVYWGQRATYLYGGRMFTHDRLMAPYLLHWEAMLRAKHRRNSLLYDFYGYSADPKHSYHAFSRFKSRFGGFPVTYAGAHDLLCYDVLADALVSLLHDSEGGVVCMDS